jgi:tetratricopeptide (TPR) repeat protein
LLAAAGVNQKTPENKQSTPIMKKSVVALVVLCGFAAGAILYFNRSKSSPPSVPVVESSPVETAAQTHPEKMAPASQDLPPANSSKPGNVPPATPVVNMSKADDAASAIRKTVDALLSAKSAGEKHELLQQLLKSGQMDQAIAELKQRAAENPNDPEIPTTIGEALINQVGAIHAAGGDINEQGILAMQADQSFNAALKIDPNNYEAQLVKSISMTYWPAEPARDAQVVQTLSGLIDRQETMPSQPGFAQTYIYLGNEYQKIGQPDKAQATWQLGLSKFPDNSTLQQKISGQ